MPIIPTSERLDMAAEAVERVEQLLHLVSPRLADEAGRLHSAIKQERDEWLASPEVVEVDVTTMSDSEPKSIELKLPARTTTYGVEL